MMESLAIKNGPLQETPSSTKPYQCTSCDFSCVNGADWTRHISTKKHKTRTDTSNPQYGMHYFCRACDFVCSELCEYDTHITTPKHKELFGSRRQKRVMIFYCNSCDVKCGKSIDFNRHLATAKHAHNTKKPESTILHNFPPNYEYRTIVPSSPLPDPDFMQCIQTMLASQAESHAAQIAVLIGAQTQTAAQTQAHAEAHAEQIKLLIEAISTQGPHTITNNNNNTTNNNNNQFNLNVFLNEDCKNAYTFKDVIESIVCTVDDLDRLIVEGYAATVIRKILESMQDMAITERPIHCTDLRRNTVCVKNATGWEKGAAALKRLNNTLYFIGKKLGNVVPEWRETYPDHFRGTDSRRNQYHKLIVEVTKVDDVKLEDRNVGIICRSLVLDRKTAKAGIM